MFRRALGVLGVLGIVVLIGTTAVAQPVITGWRPPTGCSTNQVIGWNGSTWTCQSVTAFSTNNVIPKGNGTGLTSSSWTDTGAATATTASVTLGDGSSDSHTINGSVTIADADADAGFTVNNTGTGGRSFSVLSTSNASGVPNSLLITDNTASGALRFRVDSSGNISGSGSWTLGDDDAADSHTINGLLNIQTPTSSIPVLRLGKQSASTLWGIGHDYDSTDFSFNYNNGSSWTENIFQIENTGRTTINAALSDATTFTHTLNLRNSTADNAARLSFEDSTTGAVEATINGSRVSGGGGYLAFYTRASGDGGLDHRVRIERDGDVCIGSTSCSNRLDVTGNTRVAGDILVTGSTTLGDAASDSITFNNGPVGVNRYAGRHIEYNDEWLFGSQLAVGNGWNGSTIGSPPYSLTLVGTNAAFTPQTGVQRPGVPCLETGTTSTGISGFKTSASPLVNTGDTLTWEVTLGIPTLSDSSEEFAVKVGWLQDTGVNDTYGCYALYDRGNVATSGPNSGNVHRWSLWAMDSSGGPTNITNSLTSAPTIAAVTWPNTNVQRLRITATNTFCRLEVDVGAGYVQQANITTNLSTHSLAAGMFIIKSAGTTSRSVCVDQTRFDDALAAVRSP